MTEVWFRNPDLYVREMIEVATYNFVWDRGYLHKKSLDPEKFIQAYIPPPQDFRMLIVGNHDQGAQEITRATTWKTAVQVPVWEYGDPWADLEQLIEEPEYEGQRVVVTSIPHVNTGPGRRFMRLLTELQQENRQTNVHVHGLYAWRILFGLEYGSVDIDPRTDAKKGNLLLPNGKHIKFEEAPNWEQWITLFGYLPVELSVPRNRCMYNIKSALWSGLHYRENIKFAYKSQRTVDADSKFATTPVAHNVMVRHVKAEEGDKFLCNTCSLQMSCKYFRSGAVCVVPDSEPAELARFFKTRDSDAIIEGLGTLLAAQTRRLERGMQEEELNGNLGLSSEVTKIINTLFDRGVKLAKLVNPALAQPNVKVNINSGTQISMGTPQAMMAEVVAQFEARGIARENITPDMIEEFFANPEAVKQRAIDVASVPGG